MAYRSILWVVEDKPDAPENPSMSLPPPSPTLQHLLSINTACRKEITMAHVPPGPPQTSTDAPFPFNQSSADLTLRTADSVDFRVHSQILAQASPFFASMLALPQPTNPTEPANLAAAEAHACVERVPVSEDSATLDLLLRLVYPIPKRSAQVSAEVAALVFALRAAIKYEMALPVETLSERLLAITPNEPLQVWAAACRMGLEDVALQAAEALKAAWTPTGTEALACMDEPGQMEGISAGDYFRLKQILSGAESARELPVTTATSTPTVQDVSGDAAPSPFSTDLPDPDVKCQPTSGTPFLPHQNFLSIHSPVLRTRLASLRAAAPTNTPSPPEPVVLEFDESPEVVSVLLQACYLAEDGLPKDLDSLAQALVAANKYQMARVGRYVRTAWDEAAGAQPLEAYLVAVHHGLKDCGRAAARRVLEQPIATAWAPAMNTAPALVYHRLLVYYDTCRGIAQAKLNELSGRLALDHKTKGSLCVQYKAPILATRSGADPSRSLRHDLYADFSRYLRESMALSSQRLTKWCCTLLERIALTPDEIARALDQVEIALD
ncbi:hypothetical protein C8Q77DRAFT_1143342 [Trametes polyzona]|nr:hypothetical protein C8Q77DRAFT_1143342 [Trametes polyzona]